MVNTIGHGIGNDIGKEVPRGIIGIDDAAPEAFSITGRQFEKPDLNIPILSNVR